MSMRPGLPLLLSFLFMTAANLTGAAPVTASLEAVLAAPATEQDSGSFSLYRWDRFPSILVIDTPDYNFQDRMFSRLAFFLEKRGFRGHLLDNRALETLHGWNAHDYGPEGLASFYNAAERAGVVLNPEELTLQEIVLDQGILVMERDQFASGAGGILSISRSSSVYERRLLLTHESFHGIFFASPEYRDFCFTVWDSLTPGTRAFFRGFLDELGYDSTYRYLCVNEFQAYLMQQPLRYAPEYFQRVTRRFEGKRAGVPVAGMLEAARRLNGFLESRYGLRAGATVEAERAGKDSG
ncbi:MAG TPA: hypothetical protein VMM82_12135 [Spirochaetia bacterium]|nr:hypothetical protein [Spirochaetia bacterium]